MTSRGLSQVMAVVDIWVASTNSMLTDLNTMHVVKVQTYVHTVCTACTQVKYDLENSWESVGSRRHVSVIWRQRASIQG